MLSIRRHSVAHDINNILMPDVIDSADKPCGAANCAYSKDMLLNTLQPQSTAMTYCDVAVTFEVTGSFQAIGDLVQPILLALRLGFWTNYEILLKN
ncbi:hypothetical protein RRG08_008041 [Elysia crispata]|uniref:Uncharacterized protein n=1 Tax=Elysia crispata TaxID=231223 RepID=A0AAE1DYY6_9GAST|nr:hypothetical protein RRG08_008041 [Elysia crispata]